MSFSLRMIVLIFVAALLFMLFTSMSRSSRSTGLAPSLDPVEEQSLVGTATCIRCHEEIGETHAASGHANTFHSTADFVPAKALHGKVFEDALRSNRIRYHWDSEGLSSSIPGRFDDAEFPLMYALGSGTHGVSFLTILPHSDGSDVGLEHRMTLFGAEHSPGITPGHEYLDAPTEDAEHFGRVLDPEKLRRCVECHTTGGRIEHGEVLAASLHVGCESCHGPGSSHVAAMDRGLPADTYFKAIKWPKAIDEIRTCGACHRLPETVKPSEISTTSPVLPRFQPVGMMQSPCFVKSSGRMRCTTCHDPHEKTSSASTDYHRICLSCHETYSVPDCTVAADRCVECHMPAVPIAGAAFHDHWIRVRNTDEAVTGNQKISPDH